MVYNFTAEIIRDTEINRYIGIVINLPGAHTQAETLDELHIKLQEVIRLCLEENGRYTTLPHHGNQDLGRSLVRQILREINILPEKFVDILKNQ